jgi:uncharacterized protein YjbJ (UPF0337 family)
LELIASWYRTCTPPVAMRIGADDERTDDMAGWVDEAKGRAKEAAGDLTDDDDLKREGKLDKLAGKAKDAVENTKDKVQDTIDDQR